MLKATLKIYWPEAISTLINVVDEAGGKIKITPVEKKIQLESLKRDKLNPNIISWEQLPLAEVSFLDSAGEEIKSIKQEWINYSELELNKLKEIPHIRLVSESEKYVLKEYLPKKPSKMKSKSLSEEGVWKSFSRYSFVFDPKYIHKVAPDSLIQTINYVKQMKNIQWSGMSYTSIKTVDLFFSDYLKEVMKGRPANSEEGFNINRLEEFYYGVMIKNDLAAWFLSIYHKIKANNLKTEFLQAIGAPLLIDFLDAQDFGIAKLALSNVHRIVAIENMEYGKVLQKAATVISQKWVENVQKFLSRNHLSSRDEFLLSTSPNLFTYGFDYYEKGTWNLGLRYEHRQDWRGGCAENIVAEAAKIQGWKLEPEFSYGHIVPIVQTKIMGELQGGFCASLQENVNNYLSDSIQRAVSKVSAQARPVVGVQKQYEVITDLSLVESVLYIAEPLPDPIDVNEDWVRRYDWIIRNSILDKSYFETLRLIVSQLKEKDYSEREYKVSQFLDHLRDNILHYCQAIWSQESSERRLLRYERLGYKIPINWKFIYEGKEITFNKQEFFNLSNLMEGAFFPIENCLQIPVGKIIASANPVGFSGNYAIFRLKETDGLIGELSFNIMYGDLFPMLSVLKIGLMNGKSSVDRFIIEVDELSLKENDVNKKMKQAS